MVTVPALRTSTAQTRRNKNKTMEAKQQQRYTTTGAVFKIYKPK